MDLPHQWQALSILLPENKQEQTKWVDHLVRLKNNIDGELTVTFKLKFTDSNHWLELTHRKLKLNTGSTKPVPLALSDKVAALLAEGQSHRLSCTFVVTGSNPDKSSIPPAKLTLRLDLLALMRFLLEQAPPSLSDKELLGLDGVVNTALTNALPFPVTLEQIRVSGGGLNQRSSIEKISLKAGKPTAVQFELTGPPQAWLEPDGVTLSAFAAVPGETEGDQDLTLPLPLRSSPPEDFPAVKTMDKAKSRNWLFGWSAPLALPAAPAECTRELLSLLITYPDDTQSESSDLVWNDDTSELEDPQGDMVHLSQDQVRCEGVPTPAADWPAALTFKIRLVHQQSGFEALSEFTYSFLPAAPDLHKALTTLSEQLSSNTPASPDNRTDPDDLGRKLRAAIQDMAGGAIEQTPAIFLENVAETFLTPFGRALQQGRGPRRDGPPNRAGGEQWHDLLRAFARAWAASSGESPGPEVCWPELDKGVPNDPRKFNEITLLNFVGGVGNSRSVYWTPLPTLNRQKKKTLYIAYT